MYLKLFVLLVLLGGSQRAIAAQPIEGANAVAEYHLTCDPDSFQYIIDRPWLDHYITATISHGGRTWKDVRLRLRGDGSRWSPKKSLTVKFDDEPFADGRSKINFNADIQDRSYIHAVLASGLLAEAGIPTFRAEHARLYLNGRFHGLFVRVENMDEDFLTSRGIDPRGNLYKATLDNASMSIFDDVNHHWEKKTNEKSGRGDLDDLIRDINAVPDEEYYDFARRTFDYDRMVSIIAMNMLISNGSTYYHNYYLFHDTAGDGKWFMMPWDLDLSMASYSSAYAYHRSSGASAPDNPFLERALLTAPIFDDIRRRVDELAATVFTTERLYPMIDSLETVLAPSVAQDSTDEVADLGMWRQQLAVEKAYIQQRPDALRGQFEQHPRPFPVIREPEFTAESVTFRWRPSVDPAGGSVSYTLYLSTDPTFLAEHTTAIRGLADTTHTLRPWPETGAYYWYVSAIKGSFQTDGFDSWNRLVIGSRDTLSLVVNEINYNSSDGFDPDDWIELFNPNERPVDLSGWSILDDDDRHRFFFPTGATIAPGGFVLAARDTVAFRTYFRAAGPLYGNLGFGLSGGGDQVRLMNAMGQLVDSVSYDDDPPWPAEADGLGATLELLDPELDNELPSSWAASQVTGGTPGSRNSILTLNAGEITSAEHLLQPVFPNPFTRDARVRYTLATPGHVTIRLYDITGRLVDILLDEQEPAASRVIELPAGELAAGTYFVVMGVDGRRIGTRAAVVIR